MSNFDLSKLNYILTFKLNNPPQFYNNNNIFYTAICLTKYYIDSKQPNVYGPDLVKVYYTYWHNEYGYDECKFSEDYVHGPIVILGAEYEKDIQPNWNDASSYHKYDYDSDY